MIPAILSCIFVIYLYHSLNQVDDSVGDVTDGDHQASVTSESLSARMEHIEERLDKLARGFES